MSVGKHTLVGFVRDCQTGIVVSKAMVQPRRG